MKSFLCLGEEECSGLTLRPALWDSQGTEGSAGESPAWGSLGTTGQQCRSPDAARGTETRGSGGTPGPGPRRSHGPCVTCGTRARCHPRDKIRCQPWDRARSPAPGLGVPAAPPCRPVGPSPLRDPRPARGTSGLRAPGRPARPPAPLPVPPAGQRRPASPPARPPPRTRGRPRRPPPAVPAARPDPGVPRGAAALPGPRAGAGPGPGGPGRGWGRGGRGGRGSGAERRHRINHRPPRPPRLIDAAAANGARPCPARSQWARGRAEGPRLKAAERRR